MEKKMIVNFYDDVGKNKKTFYLCQYTDLLKSCIGGDILNSAQTKKILNTSFDVIINIRGGNYVCTHLNENKLEKVDSLNYYHIPKSTPYKRLNNHPPKFVGVFNELVDIIFKLTEKNINKKGFHPSQVHEEGIRIIRNKYPIISTSAQFKEIVLGLSTHYVQVKSNSDYVCVFNRMFFQFYKQTK